MKKKKDLLFLLLIIVSVGVTIAYLQSTSVLENLFEAGTYKTITHEEFVAPTNWMPGDEIPKTITTKNEGTIPVRVRVNFKEEWTNADGSTIMEPYFFYVSSNCPYIYIENCADKVSIINFDNEEDWFKVFDEELFDENYNSYVYNDEKIADYYFYYIDELLPGETTSSPIKSVTFNPNYDDVFCTYSNNTATCESSGEWSFAGATYKLTITTETVQADKYLEVWGGEDVPIMKKYIGDNPCTFDGKLEDLAYYENGQYAYEFVNYVSTYYRYYNTLGWRVYLKDSESQAPINSTLCSSINGFPIVDMSGLFNNVQTSSIDLSSFDTSNVLLMDGMFYNSSINSLNLSNLNTSEVFSMGSMFNGASIGSLNINGLDTSNVIDMSQMFYESDIGNLNLSNLDTGNVINMNDMFGKITMNSLDLSGFDTSDVKIMSGMFKDSEINILNISSFDTSNVESMSYMFNNYKGTVDLSNFDTSNVYEMNGMFQGFDGVLLNLDNLDTSSVTYMGSMFEGCKLTTLDLSSFDMTNVTYYPDMFKNSLATTGYAKTQADADKFNSSSNKPAGLTFVVKNN